MRFLIKTAYNLSAPHSYPVTQFFIIARHLDKGIGCSGDAPPLYPHAYFAKFFDKKAFRALKYAKISIRIPTVEERYLNILRL